MILKKPLTIAACILSISAVCQNSGLAAEGAKGLFFAQMQKPQEKMNTGIQYWVELHRDGQVLKVNNKTAYHSGDKIRFHVKPNIDGYAYILLRSGSRGEQSVLFPDPRMSEDNRITRGKDIALPQDGLLAFDENPGTEKVTLLVSRMPVDATTYLKHGQDQSMVVACAPMGSKDLIPSRIVLNYSAPAAAIKVIHKPAPKPVVTKTAASKRGSGKSALESNGETAADQNPVDESTGGEVTVVYNDPSGILSVDVALEHQ